MMRKESNIIIRSAQKDDYQSLAEWLVEISQNPQDHCLHSWAGQSNRELRDQLLAYRDDGELCYIIAVQDGKLVSAFGSEFDRELGKGWLHGPHAIGQDRREISQELYGRLMSELPAGIKKLGAYLNIENRRGRQFYRDQGFKERDNLSFDFWLTAERRDVSGKRGCVPIRKEQVPAFQKLYEGLFPKTYYSAQRVVEMIGKSHQILVEAQGEKVRGFVVMTLEDGKSSGEIQFLGVDKEYRGMGYGRRLLLSAADWLFDAGGVTRISLNVNEELVQARKLYESAGFRLQFTGIGLEKNPAN